MSDWKEDSKKRRDFRASKDGPESTGPKKRKKDKKRWCKGKVGVEHNYVLHKTFNLFSRKHKINKCTNCGREEWTSEK